MTQPWTEANGVSLFSGTDVMTLRSSPQMSSPRPGSVSEYVLIRNSGGQ